MSPILVLLMQPPACPRTVKLAQWLPVVSREQQRAEESEPHRAGGGVVLHPMWVWAGWKGAVTESTGPSFPGHTLKTHQI